MIKVTNNEYQKICKTLADRIFAKDNTKITIDEYNRILDEKYEIIPFDAGNKKINKIVNILCNESYEDENYIRYKGHVLNNSICYSSLITDNFNNKIFDNYYYIIMSSENLLSEFSYCEGDINITVYKNLEEYKKGIQKTKKFIKENY